jgi:hypothetical protein
VLSYAAYSGIGLPLELNMIRPLGMSLFRAGMMRGSGEARVLYKSLKETRPEADRKFFNSGEFFKDCISLTGAKTYLTISGMKEKPRELVELNSGNDFRLRLERVATGIVNGFGLLREKGTRARIAAAVTPLEGLETTEG